MKNNKKYPRYKSPSDMDFHGTDRALTKRMMSSENYEMLPISESMRKAVFRGDNAHGDNTSFGCYSGGQITWKYFEKLLNKYVGKEFSVYYSAMTILFSNKKDRDNFDNFISHNFNKTYRFGYLMCSYEVVDGMITKLA